MTVQIGSHIFTLTHTGLIEAVAVSVIGWTLIGLLLARRIRRNKNKYGPDPERPELYSKRSK